MDGGGTCPGCKEKYKVGEYEDDDETPVVGFASGVLRTLPAPGMGGQSSNDKSLVTKQTAENFDHNRWLFETKGTYGYGSASPGN